LVIHQAYNTGEIEMAQQGSNGKGQDANVNKAAASPSEDVEPTKIDQPAVEKPVKSSSSTKTSARKATTKKKTASSKKAAPKKKAIPKKKAAPKKKPAQAQVAVTAPDSAENKTQSAPEAPGHKPQLIDHAPDKVIHEKKRGSLWPWIILVAMVGVGIYLLNNGMLGYRISGDKETTVSHGDDMQETQGAPLSREGASGPSAPPRAREGIDRPRSTALDVEQNQLGTVEPSSTRTFGGRIAEKSVMPQGTAVVPSSPETGMTPMDQSYPPLEPTVPLATDGSLIEPQQAGVEELSSERQTTVTTATEKRTATSPRSRDQDFNARDVPVTRAEGQVPALSREHLEADSGVTARSGERYPPAETNKATTGNAEEVPVTSGSTAETADNSKANPEIRPRANPRPSSNPPPYWNRPYRPYGSYGTSGRYQTYPPAAPHPYPYGYRFATPRPQETH
jgi:hypothetical protein